MTNRIHILGAAGSGTTTLGRAISEKYGLAHFDTDDFFWETKYSIIRNKEERLALIQRAIENQSQWILSGSLCGWGDPLIQYFDLVIFICIPPDIRKKRLEDREHERYGDSILPGNDRHNAYLEFMNWALQYDSGDENIRSRKVHEAWLQRLDCPVLRIEGTPTVSEELNYYTAFVLDAKTLA